MVCKGEMLALYGSTMTKKRKQEMAKRKRNKQCNGQKKKRQTMQWSKEKGTKRQ
jgi:hypothetical protein